MKRKILADISASTFQIVVNQLSGIIVFYILSKCLAKDVFGELNWSTALFIIAFNTLSFGIDQIVVRRIAAGDSASSLLSLHLVHVCVSSLLFYGLLLVCSVFFERFFNAHYLLLWIGFSQLLVFISSPFKQVVNGKEQFGRLMVMSCVAGVTRAMSLLLLAILDTITLKSVIAIFVLSTAVEFLICLALVFLQFDKFSFSWHWKKYFSLVKESMPQLAVMILNAGILRFDWIILGLLASQTILANYSFAYRAVELSALPLMIVAPLLLPRLTRYFTGISFEYQRAQKLNDLLVCLRLSIVLACITSLVLNLVWVDLIDAITDNKYGAANKINILILSAALPFIYLNNFLWTVYFATNRLKRIAFITLVAFLVNIGGDLLFIPFFQAEGAAVAIVIAFIVQSILYSQKANIPGLTKIWQTILFCGLGAASCGWIANYGPGSSKLSLIVALAAYPTMLIVGNQVKAIDWLTVKRMIR